MAGRGETLRELQSAFQPNSNLSEALLHNLQKHGLLLPLASFLSSPEHCLNVHEQFASAWMEQVFHPIFLASLRECIKFLGSGSRVNSRAC